MSNKIGVFCPTLNVYGGGEFVAIAIANTLAQNNRDVILFSSDKINPNNIKKYFGETLHPNILHIQQPAYFTPRGMIDFYQTIIYSYIAKRKCHHFVDAFTNCVYPWSQISYIHFPYLNRHTFKPTFPYLNYPRFNQAGILPHVILEKKLIDYSKRLILVNSYYTAKEISVFSQKPVHVLYPPFASALSEIGKTTSKSLRENLVVTTSRLDSNKLLERIPLIASQTTDNIHYAIIGRLYNPSMLDYLQTKAKKLGVSNRIKFYPNASVTQKIDLLKRAKIYLHTMIGEHFGISIVEAMALGCLPIVHDSGGMREFVPEQYRYQTITEAAEKINQQIIDWSPDKSEDVKMVAGQFSIKNFSNRFMELYSRYQD
ncbi:MAG: glycosyltransferase [Crenarchaeota archaeon]|jgi:glycosyltransferase involved in cell wall biosynthesis|nr:glycosyltransferase [Thermoproteota archaeon]